MWKSMNEHSFEQTFCVVSGPTGCRNAVMKLISENIRIVFVLGVTNSSSYCAVVW